MKENATINTGNYRLNSKLIGLRCIRCNELFSLDSKVDDGLGCPTCLANGFPASLVCAYDNLDRDFKATGRKRGMLRFGRYLPYETFPTLGEGDSPLVPVAGLAASLGITDLWVKNEGQSPTGSHKDRMSAQAVARAVMLGKDTVVAASSGNAGASLAAYASAAGIRCAIVCTNDITSAWATAITNHGAELHTLKSHEERWPFMQQMVQEKGWYPITNFLSPPVSSNPFGIDGYKTIAYELFEDLETTMPSVIVIPTCRGDVLAGIFYGFNDLISLGILQKMPRLIAVEPGPRLTRVLSGEDYRNLLPVGENRLTSIGGDTATYQSFNALTKSNGSAVFVDTAHASECRRKLARHGLYLELSAAASLAGAEQLATQGYLNSGDKVVLLGTSHGYKEPADPA